jgi:hypothetical protein
VYFLVMSRLLGFWGLLGGLVALPLDALHVVTGVLTYQDPVLGLQDWWAVPLFIGAGLALGFGHRFAAVPLSHMTARKRPPPATLGAAGLGLLALVFAYGSSGLLQGWPLVAFFVYVAVFVAAVIAVDKDARPALVLHALGTAIIGPLVEVAISSTGAFSYTHPDVWGVAIWLPGIYLNAGVASHLLDRWLLGRRQIA